MSFKFLSSDKRIFADDGLGNKILTLSNHGGLHWYKSHDVYVAKMDDKKVLVDHLSFDFTVLMLNPADKGLCRVIISKQLAKQIFQSAKNYCEKKEISNL